MGRAYRKHVERELCIGFWWKPGKKEIIRYI
jgi:hypothetical protein